MKRFTTITVMALAMITASVKASVTVPIPLSVMLQEVGMGAKLMHGTVTLDSTNAHGSVGVVLTAPHRDSVWNGTLVIKMKFVSIGNKTSIQAVEALAHASDGGSACFNKKQLALFEKMYAQELTGDDRKN
jgi:hypothetical protein